MLTTEIRKQAKHAKEIETNKKNILSKRLERIHRKISPNSILLAMQTRPYQTIGDGGTKANKPNKFINS